MLTTAMLRRMLLRGAPTHRLFACGTAAALTCCPTSSTAQTADRTPNPDPPSAIESPRARDRIVEDPGFWAWLQAVPDDFVGFASWQNARVLGIGGAAALGAHPWDDTGIEASQTHLRPALFRVGNTGGGFLMQVGAGVAVYSIARQAGADALASTGSDLIRGHLLSQAVVQAAKAATRRTRPDASDRRSLPSGHTAAAFTTAAVFGRHFGWRVGIPAYAFGTYVAASRMAVRKHHLSDVVLGAAVGLAAGRTVSARAGAARIAVGVAPLPGGAAISLSAASPPR